MKMSAETLHHTHLCVLLLVLSQPPLHCVQRSLAPQRNMPYMHPIATQTHLCVFLLVFCQPPLHCMQRAAQPLRLAPQRLGLAGGSLGSRPCLGQLTLQSGRQARRHKQIISKMLSMERGVVECSWLAA